MSRLFRDTVRIVLHPARIALTRTAGGLRHRELFREARSVAAGTDRGGAALLDALRAVLADPRWQDADARVVVSSALVRFAIVPAGAQLLKESDEVAMALLRFQQAHGGTVPALDIRLSAPISGKGQIAAALERKFTTGLMESLRAARLRVTAVEPLLMHAFNAARASVADGDFWFASAEPGWLTLARMRRGHWESVAVSRCDGSVAERLGPRVREEMLVSGGESFPRRLYLHAATRDEGLPADVDVEVVKLKVAPWLRADAADLAQGA